MDRSGRAGMRRRRPPPINQAITQTSELSKKIPEVSKIEMEINQADFTTPAQSISSSNPEVAHRRPVNKDIPFYPDPIYIPAHNSKNSYARKFRNTNINPEINIDFEENFPFQEGVILETYHRPDK